MSRTAPRSKGPRRRRNTWSRHYQDIRWRSTPTSIREKLSAALINNNRMTQACRESPSRVPLKTWGCTRARVRGPSMAPGCRLAAASSRLQKVWCKAYTTWVSPKTGSMLRSGQAIHEIWRTKELGRSRQSRRDTDSTNLIWHIIRITGCSAQSLVLKINRRLITKRGLLGQVKSPEERKWAYIGIEVPGWSWQGQTWPIRPWRRGRQMVYAGSSAAMVGNAKVLSLSSLNIIRG